MIRLKSWQWLILILPVALVIGFLVIAAGIQIHRWHLSWIWAVVVVILVGWRWLLVRWLQIPQLETAGFTRFTATEHPEQELTELAAQAEAQIQKIIVTTRDDALPWEDWAKFFERCQNLVSAVAQVYYPQVKRPLLNIYIPQA